MLSCLAKQRLSLVEGNPFSLRILVRRIGIICGFSKTSAPCGYVAHIPHGYVAHPCSDLLSLPIFDLGRRCGAIPFSAIEKLQA